MGKQRTIRKALSIEGRGLHTGSTNKLTFLPADEDSGVVFETYKSGKTYILPAYAEYVCETARGTSLCSNGFVVRTVEHLLAAIRALQIDNIKIVIEGEEVPILNGSAYPFMQFLNECEIIEQQKERTVYAIEDIITIEDKKTGTRISIEPYPAFDVTCHVEYQSKILPQQIVSLNGNAENFAQEFAIARTFVFLHEIMDLLRYGLIKGGDLENAIVFVDQDISDEERQHLSKYFHVPEGTIAENGILGGTKLYFKDEPARHKMVDLIGDLSLAGFYFTGKIYAYKPGHYFNTLFAKEIRQYIIQRYGKGKNSSV